MPSHTNLQVVDASAPATWAEARKLVTQVRAGARAWLQLGEVLEELRSEYFAPHRLTAAGPGRGNSGKQSPHDAVPVSDERGWQAKVREEIGISDDTARKWITGKTVYSLCGQIEQLPDGETIDHAGKSWPITEEARRKAGELKEALMLGQVPLTRALPAFAGMFTVEGGKGAGGKAATNHPANTWAGLQKLRTSLDAKHWRQGKIPGRASWDLAVDEWAALLRQLPDELRAATAAWVQKGMPRQER